MIHAFTFDKIEGYGSQTSDGIRDLQLGVTVLFAASDGKVSSVALGAKEGGSDCLS